MSSSAQSPAAAPVRVRFAPSPTGHLHVGGARTALYNWLFARHAKGSFILRIEDTDAARSTDESVRGILEAMRWLGLDWDEGPEVGGPHGPYFQSERRGLYRAAADALLAAGRAYPCFCTAETLAALREEQKAAGDAEQGYDGRCGRLDPAAATARVAAGEPHAIRLRVPREGAGEVALDDLIRGRSVFKHAVIEDFVLLKSDGLPTYNFAVVVDDDAMGITHVIRGDDHISNTPRHLLLYAALGYPLPAFAHLPMILGADKTRLSKRHGASSVQEFERQGILPQAMLNYLALLGWSLDGKTEFFTPKKLVESFSLKRVGANPAVFDPDKLAWLNGEHFARLDRDEKVLGTYRELERRGIALPPVPEIHERLGAMIQLLGKRLKSFPEAAWSLEHFFRALPEYDPAVVAERLGGAAAERLAGLAAAFGALPAGGFAAAELEAALRGEAARTGADAAELIHALRVAVSGRGVSPDIFRMCELLGREAVLRRLTERAWERAAGVEGA
ncbi:glutamate--tRNA ligase [bacterium]|nr:glutamate--tRNA ligase [bacterium]